MPWRWWFGRIVRIKVLVGIFQRTPQLQRFIEVALNHFIRGRGDDYSGDQVYFQGHASPGIYSRAFLEGRLTEKHLENFRRELAEGGGSRVIPTLG